jgi:acetyl-CoA carboxylase biotin carboxyl carrier protein
MQRSRPKSSFENFDSAPIQIGTMLRQVPSTRSALTQFHDLGTSQIKATTQLPELFKPLSQKPGEQGIKRAVAIKMSLLSLGQAIAYKGIITTRCRCNFHVHRWDKARETMTKNIRDADVAFIQALAKVLRENDLTEVKVKREYGEDDSLDVRVSRQQPQQVMAAAVAAPVAAAPAAAAPAASADPASDPGAVTSPMVGTIYLAAEPGAPAFVSVGTVVAEGDTLLIVEAMKTMNHIPAPRAGKVTRILVDDGSAVEFGSPLVILE